MKTTIAHDFGKNKPVPVQTSTPQTVVSESSVPHKPESHIVKQEPVTGIIEKKLGTGRHQSWEILHQPIFWSLLND